MDTSEVRAEHKFDKIALDKYLVRHLRGYPSNSNESLLVRQYRYYVFVLLDAQFSYRTDVFVKFYGI